jgi:hypothetical protein
LLAAPVVVAAVVAAVVVRLLSTRDTRGTDNPSADDAGPPTPKPAGLEATPARA